MNTIMSPVRCMTLDSICDQLKDLKDPKDPNDILIFLFRCTLRLNLEEAY